MGHEEGTDTRSHSVLMGFFAGLLVGAGLGLLLAPRPGSEVRRGVAASADDLRRRASETLHHSQERMSHAVERGRDVYNRARHIADRTRPHAAEAGHEALEDVSQAAEPLREGIKGVAG
ncbi:MAG: hypothetical protein GEU99_16625 [Luteitalea sp.]|nr:hypothetical protein [Luteitalea sp.]